MAVVVEVVVYGDECSEDAGLRFPKCFPEQPATRLCKR